MDLNFTLSPSSAQKLHESLIALSKFSEYVSLEARRSRLTLSSLNSSKSAYAAVTLASNKFFEAYNFPSPSQSQDNRFTCRFYAKALLSAFRQRYFDSKSGDTAIEKCDVRFVEKAKGECRMLVRLLCKNRVLKTYRLTYEEVDVMHAVFDKDAARNMWVVKGRLLREFMEHFGPKAEQLDISGENGRAAFTSFTEKLVDGKEILKQPLQTSVSFDTADFDTFGAEDGVHVAVSLKDFKAIVAHADSLHASVTAYYSDAGRPLQVTYEQEGMSCEFTLMTLGDNRAAQTFTTTRVQHRPPAPPAAPPPPMAPPPQSQTDTSSQRQDMMGPPGSLRSQFAGSFRSQRMTEDRVIQPVEDHQSSGSLYRSRLNVSGTSNSRSISAFTQEQEPELPPVPASAVPPAGLFLPYSSSEESDDDDLGKVAWDEPYLKWDTNFNSDDRPRPVLRDRSPPPPPPRVPPPAEPRKRKRVVEPSGDTTQSEEEQQEEDEINARTVVEVVGPTQEVAPAQSLFGSG
ncbi:Rad9-domain-containing protein [Choiromyces venosus 120613-1]|uniref:Rad9-domain-containing protein n=1 Tax=Choiromyces venosus 120613-1 TaxID=1336337 RepID=A0A3N4JNZ1_9PEZI|nr:Rad9-domain-containing protein [Choiromyces venosus 120613-1]